MRKLSLFVSVFVMTTVLAACGGNNDNGQQQDNDTSNSGEHTQMNEQQSGQQSDNSEDQKQKMDQLNFTDFELEVDYGQDQEVEAEIEIKNGVIKADLEDEINGENLDGAAAFDKLYPMVQKLNIQKDTAKEDAIAQVLEAFDLNDDYEKFELEITFDDGVKMEYEDRK